MEANHRSETLVHTVEVGAITVISVQTLLLTDIRIIAAVADEVRGIARRSNLPNILLDFHRVEHLSIDFVSEMKVITDDIEMRGGTIRCCSLRKEMRALLEILGLHTLYVGNSAQHAVIRYKSCLEKQGDTKRKTATSG